jgi:tRNA(Ile)-lysidine synthase
MAGPHPLESALAASWPPSEWRDVSVLVAVSGGADSVALLRAMHALKTGGEGRLLAAHLNHGLRGPEADADQAFVADLCAKLGVPCHVGRTDVEKLAAERGNGLEEAAREARYQFLTRTAAESGARYLVTAHTADDRVETILHRILRGTGIAGLAGIGRTRFLPEAGLTLIRPLLDIRRTELLAYLDELDQPFREDPSNRDPRFTRNRIRHELLPVLAERFNPGVAEALLRLGTLAGELQVVVDGRVEELAARSVAARSPGHVEIDPRPLADQPRYLVRELLIAVWREQGWPMQAMGFAEWDELAGLAAELAVDPSARHPRRVFPGGVMAEADSGRLALRG